MQSSETTRLRPTSEFFRPNNDEREKSTSYNKHFEGLPEPVTRAPNPHKKYSKKWIGHGWAIAVEERRWPRVIYLLVGLILISVWIGIMIVFANEEVTYERANLGQGPPRGNNPRLDGDLVLKGVLKKFDPVERTLKVAWSLVTLKQDGNTQTFEDFGTNATNSLAINIYRDVIAINDTRSIPSNLTGTELGTELAELIGLKIDNDTAIPIAVLGRHPWDDVTTEIDFAQSTANYAWQQPLFAYPFDQWTGNIVFAATDRDAIEVAGLRNGFAFGIDHAVLADSTLNWRITLEENNTCNPPDDDSSAVPFGCELHLTLTGTRPPLVRFAAIVAAIVNWLTTTGIFLIVCESVILKRTYILRETDILAVCLTALFALPSVRLILPGAPDFGAIIDLIGIIPNIIIISLCTTVTAVSKLRMRPPAKEE